MSALIPSERAVLMQVRDLFQEATARTYRLTALMSRWPHVHFDAYRAGYAGLIQKGLLVSSADGQIFTITPRGLSFMA